MLYNFIGEIRGNASSKSSDTSTISLNQIYHIMEGLKTRQFQDTTTQNYHGIWKNFNKFIIRLDIIPQTWEERVAAYGTYLYYHGIQSSTLKSYISAIKTTLMLDDYEWNDDKLKLTILIRACKMVNDKVKTRLPIKKRTFRTHII